MRSGVRLARFDYVWVESWVEDMQREGLAPSTITKKVSGLARVVDWSINRKLVTLPQNPLRQLPVGYSTNGDNSGKLYSGERNRRLELTEEGAIRSVLTDKKETLLFDMALETAMRMSEMLGLRMADIDLKARTIFLDRTKNGQKRQVCPDLRFHDLLHEATSRIYERTTLTDLEVASITGHTNLRMLQRYANLRRSTLAGRLW